MLGIREICALSSSDSEEEHEQETLGPFFEMHYSKMLNYLPKEDMITMSILNQKWNQRVESHKIWTSLIDSVKGKDTDSKSKKEKSKNPTKLKLKNAQKSNKKAMENIISKDSIKPVQKSVQQEIPKPVKNKLIEKSESEVTHTHPSKPISKTANSALNQCEYKRGFKSKFLEEKAPSLQLTFRYRIRYLKCRYNNA